MAREHNARAWLVWHAAYLPNQKRPVRMEQLMVQADGSGPARRRAMSVAEIDTVMRQWRVAMATAGPATPSKPRK